MGGSLELRAGLGWDSRRLWVRLGVGVGVGGAHHSSQKLVTKGAAIASAGVIAGLEAGFPCRAVPKPGSALGGVNKQLLIPANKLVVHSTMLLMANQSAEFLLDLRASSFSGDGKSCAWWWCRAMDIPIFSKQLFLPKIAYHLRPGTPLVGCTLVAPTCYDIRGREKLSTTQQST